MTRPCWILAFLIGLLSGCAMPVKTSEPITQTDIDELVAALDLGRQAWISGQLETTATDLMVQDAEMTIFGPFGGFLQGTSSLGPRQAQIVKMFKGGSGSLQVLKSFAEGDLLVLVLMERNTVLFDDNVEPSTWQLRTTQVFRRDAGRWIRLHRHADPLVRIRSLDETVRLQSPPSR